MWDIIIFEIVIKSKIPVFWTGIVGDLPHEIGGGQDSYDTEERNRSFADCQVSWDVEPRGRWAA